MRVHLVENWRWVLRRAWSLRLNVLAVILSAAEMAVQLVGDQLPIPPLWLGGLAMFVTIAAAGARLVAQPQGGGAP